MAYTLPYQPVLFSSGTGVGKWDVGQEKEGKEQGED
jgi:hypothetical protein